MCSKNKNFKNEIVSNRRKSTLPEIRILAPSTEGLDDTISTISSQNDDIEDWYEFAYLLMALLMYFLIPDACFRFKT